MVVSSHPRDSGLGQTWSSALSNPLCLKRLRDFHFTSSTDYRIHRNHPNLYKRKSPKHRTSSTNGFRLHLIVVADPLSIAASVAGLATAAQMISVGISKLLSSKSEGFKDIIEVRTTVDTRFVVQEVQLLLLNQAKSKPERAAMIMFKELASTLTGPR